MMQQIHPGDRFHHFKGNSYQIIALAKDSETGEQMVVYQGLYGDFETFVRPLSMFMSEVDKEKYPDAPQEKRFEKIDAPASPASVSAPAASAPAASAVPAAATSEVNDGPAVRAAYDKTAVDRMMDFFDTDDFEEKYRILKAMRQCNDLTDNIIDNMAATIDVVIDDGDIDDRFNQLIKCVATRRKFETSRLR